MDIFCERSPSATSTLSPDWPSLPTGILSLSTVSPPRFSSYQRTATSSAGSIAANACANRPTSPSMVKARNFNAFDSIFPPFILILYITGKEFYVCDFKGHCVVVFSEDGKFLRRIGHENITNYPNGIDVSDAGDVLIGDSHGNRFHVAVFTREGELVTEFECPYVKVRTWNNSKCIFERFIFISNDLGG